MNESMPVVAEGEQKRIQTLEEISQELVEMHDIPLVQAEKLAKITTENESQNPYIAAEKEQVAQTIKDAIADWKMYNHNN